MFSFHKPKVYRSTQGCCICKAKSSSSRFTDSKRYEIDFIECFQLEVPRQGEICNACVLLVKRFKRLPPGSDRHWGHVVDARVGPGLKSMTKFKKRCEENGGRASPTENIKRLKQEVAAKHAADDAAAAAVAAANGSASATTTSSSCTSSFVPQKFRKIFRKTKKKRPTDCHDENMMRLLASGLEAKQWRQTMTSRRRKDYVPRKNFGGVRVSDVEGLIGDSVQWRRLKTCCGYVMENRVLSALMVDLSAMNVCPEHTQLRQQEREAAKVQQQWQQPQGVMPKMATMTALKKHQLYLNRALLNGDLQYANPIPAALALSEAPESKLVAVETVLDLSEKLVEFSNGLVKRVAENNKFSDNSSDSGYEELSSVNETTTEASVVELKKVVLASGFPLTQQLPTNLSYKRSPNRMHDRVDTSLFARKAAATGN